MDLIGGVGVSLRGGFGVSEDVDSAAVPEIGAFKEVRTRASSRSGSERSSSFVFELDDGGCGDFDRFSLRRSLAALELAICFDLTAAADVSSI